jgi:N-acetylmuramoyl-L-alanine amidase
MARVATKIRLAGVVFIFAAVIIFAIISVRLVMRARPAMADLTTLPTIVIDPGHGGVDGGAVNKQGDVVEKVINLNICLMLRDFFVLNGFDVIMTRSEDISIHDEGIESVKKQKTSDLNNRLKIAEFDPNTVFISVHQNKFTSSKSRGTQIFYSPNNPGSERYAEIMQENFVESLQPENERKHKKAGKNLFLMTKAKCPAVLVECGFLSNPGETELMISKDYQSKVAFVIFMSTMKFLGLDEAAVY